MSWLFRKIKRFVVGLMKLKGRLLSGRDVFLHHSPASTKNRPPSVIPSQKVDQLEWCRKEKIYPTFPHSTTMWQMRPRWHWHFTFPLFCLGSEQKQGRGSGRDNRGEKEKNMAAEPEPYPETQEPRQWERTRDGRDERIQYLGPNKAAASLLTSERRMGVSSDMWRAEMNFKKLSSSRSM